MANKVNRRTLLKTGAAGWTLMISSLAVSKLAAQEGPAQVVIGFSQEPTVMHPHMPNIEVDAGIHYNLFDPLFIVDPAGNFQPSLAREVPTVDNGGISEDGLNWRVKLRDDVNWHDGEPFTAEDVKFTLELNQNPDFNAIRRTGHELVRNIQIVNDYELTWEMAHAFAPYPAILSSTFIVPAHILAEAKNPNETDFRSNPIGTGAFRFSDRVAGNYILLTANKDYFGEGPYLDRAIFRYIPDMTVLFTQFRTGEIDVIGFQGIQPNRYEQALQIPEREIVVAPSSAVESITFNMGKPIFQDRAVRHALSLALDRDSIVEALYYGIPKQTESFLPQESYYYNEDLPKAEFDLAKAAEILDEAGWRPGADGVREKNGVRLAFKNSTTAGNNVREQAQQLIQQDYASIGIEMEISNFPPAVMWGEYWMMSQFDTVMVGIPFTTGPDPDVSNHLHSSKISAQGGSGQNTWQYKNAKVDELLEQGGRVFVPEKRKEIYDEIQRLVHEDMPFLPIFQYANLRGHRTGLEGFDPNANIEIETWNLNEWRWV